MEKLQSYLKRDFPSLVQEFNQLGGGINVNVCKSDMVCYFIPTYQKYLSQGIIPEKQNQSTLIFKQHNQKKEYQFDKCFTEKNLIMSDLLQAQNIQNFLLKGYSLSYFTFGFENQINIYNIALKILQIIKENSLESSTCAVSYRPNIEENLQSENLFDIFANHEIFKNNQASFFEYDYSTSKLLTIIKEQTMVSPSKIRNLNTDVIKIILQFPNQKTSQVTLIQFYDEVFQQMSSQTKYEQRFESQIIQLLTQCRQAEYTSQERLSQYFVKKNKFIDFLIKNCYDNSKIILYYDFSKFEQTKYQQGHKKLQAISNTLNSISKFSNISTVCYKQKHIAEADNQNNQFVNVTKFTRNSTSFSPSPDKTYDSRSHSPPPQLKQQPQLQQITKKQKQNTKNNENLSQDISQDLSQKPYLQNQQNKKRSHSPKPHQQIRQHSNFQEEIKELLFKIQNPQTSNKYQMSNQGKKIQNVSYLDQSTQNQTIYYNSADQSTNNNTNNQHNNFQSNYNTLDNDRDVSQQSHYLSQSPTKNDSSNNNNIIQIHTKDRLGEKLKNVMNEKLSQLNYDIIKDKANFEQIFQEQQEKIYFLEEKLQQIAKSDNRSITPLIDLYEKQINGLEATIQNLRSQINFLTLPGGKTQEQTEQSLQQKQFKEFINKLNVDFSEKEQKLNLLLRQNRQTKSKQINQFFCEEKIIHLQNENSILANKNDAMLNNMEQLNKLVHKINQENLEQHNKIVDLINQNEQLKENNKILEQIANFDNKENVLRTNLQKSTIQQDLQLQATIQVNNAQLITNTNSINRSNQQKVSKSKIEKFDQAIPIFSELINPYFAKLRNRQQSINYDEILDNMQQIILDEFSKLKINFITLKQQQKVCYDYLFQLLSNLEKNFGKNDQHVKQTNLFIRQYLLENLNK